MASCFGRSRIVASLARSSQRDLGDRPPVFAVVAGDREDAGPHRAGAGLAVVLAHEVGQGEGEVAIPGTVDPEEIPARLPVPPVLVLLALHVAAERGLADRLDLAQRAALEVGVEADRLRLGAAPAEARS